MEVIARGAEAILYKKGEMLVKERIKKNYRIRQIDLKLRKERTNLEAKLLLSARRAGVLTPKVVEVDNTKFRITMEFLEGERVKELLDKLSKKRVARLCYEIGKYIGRLHSIGIIHGDLTTSNMIVSGGKLYFIDFGLGFFSRKVEDKGTDLHLLYEAIKATHWDLLNTCWKNVKKGYKEEYKNAEMVLKRLKEIEKRGRYVRR